MIRLILSFKESAKEFKSINALATTGLLIALRTVLAVFLSFQITDTLRISVSFLANVIIGALYGPVVGFVSGAVGDLVQFVIKPTGAFFPGWTLSAALSGLVFGVFFYKRFPKKPLDIKYIILCIAAITVETIFVNILLGTFWCTVMYGKGFGFYLTSRFTKNIIQLPINVFLTYVILVLIRKVKKSGE
ncbi:MAG: folate family ECF transporter S component [Lachnospira sp.]|nr:folate family ECF transporter S component [Lachnospira sp.]